MIVNLLLTGLTIIFVTTATIWSALMVTTIAPTSGAPVTFYILAAARTGLRALIYFTKGHTS